jgi:hypothetical protein
LPANEFWLAKFFLYHHICKKLSKTDFKRTKCQFSVKFSAAQPLSRSAAQPLSRSAAQPLSRSN